MGKRGGVARALATDKTTAPGAPRQKAKPNRREGCAAAQRKRRSRTRRKKSSLHRGQKTRKTRKEEEEEEESNVGTRTKTKMRFWEGTEGGDGRLRCWLQVVARRARHPSAFVWTSVRHQPPLSHEQQPPTRLRHHAHASGAHPQQSWLAAAGRQQVLGSEAVNLSGQALLPGPASRRRCHRAPVPLASTRSRAARRPQKRKQPSNSKQRLWSASPCPTQPC